MKRETKVLSGLLIIMTAISCKSGSKDSSTEESDFLAGCPVVGQYVQTGNDKILSTEETLLADTVRFPLSYFAEEIEIIKLDNREEALVGATEITISDHYILAHSGYPPKAFKLFDKKGVYIGDVGAVGEGPGEYRTVYDAQIDELNQRIYLMPWQSDRLLVFDMQGKALDPIPLGVRCPKAKIKVDAAKGTITVFSLPWPQLPAFVWTQDMTGKHLGEIAPGHLAVTPNFNTEICCYSNMENVSDFSLYCMDPTRADSLYQYDMTNNRLQPVFTFHHKAADPVPWHGYCEWPHHFVGNFSGPPVVEQHEHGTTMTQGETFHYIIDKKTGKGAYLKMYNDYFGNLEIGYPSYAFSKGYFIRNMEPGVLLADIEKALKNKDLSDEMRKKLTDLQGTINEEDNNYVLIARLKK